MVNKILLLALMALVIVSMVSVSGCLSDVHANGEYTTVNVTEKHIDSGGSSDSAYVIVTDKGLFEINRPLLDTFNSARNPDTLYAMVQPNHSYVFHTYGYRLDWDYDYPIVVDVSTANTTG